MNVLITGANGQLAKSFLYVVNNFKPNKNNNYIFADRNTLDITNKSKLNDFLVNNNISIIINCAAFTNVKNAEYQYFDANSINNVAVKNIADLCKELNILLIHISTDYVFNGLKKLPYNENDECDPLNLYGLTKHNGELSIMSSNCNYIIIRTSWLYSEYNNNFVKTIIKKINDKTKTIYVCDDQYGSPTYALDLSYFIFYYIENELYNSYVNQIYHYSNDGYCTWYDFAVYILNTIKNNKLCNNIESEIVPKSTTFISELFNDYTPRPSYSILSKDKIKNNFKNILIPYWTNSLNKCILNIYDKKY